MKSIIFIGSKQFGDKNDAGRLASLSAAQLGDGFQVRHVCFEDLVFHDLRHEAASRLAGKLSAQELCKMMGWKTLQMAMRYYHPTAEDLVKKVG